MIILLLNIYATCSFYLDYIHICNSNIINIIEAWTQLDP